jgi:hypothetical protein
VTSENDNPVPDKPSVKLPPAQPDSAAKSPARSPLSPRRVRRFLDWLLLREAVGRARAEEASTPPERAAMLRLARAYADVADTVFDSDNKVPLAPVLSLYRESIFLLLGNDLAGKKSLAVAFETAPQSILVDAARNDASLARLHDVLVLHAALGLADGPTPEYRDVAHVTRTSVRAMLDLADAGSFRQLLRRRHRRAGFAVGALLAVLVLATSFGVNLFAPQDMAEGQPWRASSTLAAVFTAKVLFHTNEELGPWFEIDLGRAKSVRSLYVRNRADCCQERAVPLVVEVSNDRLNWHMVARRDSLFLIWEPSFPAVEARYVRLRVLRFTSFHLEQVKVF